MVITYHFRTDDLCNVWEALVLKHSISILPILWKACSSEYFCFLVFVPKFGQPQSHTSDVGIIKTVSYYLLLEKVPKLLKLEKYNYSIYEDLVERRGVTCQKSRHFG